jgi:phosphoribosylformylglycinamidine synthase
MMEILRGSPALSAFRINKLLARFQAARLPVHNIYAEYVHFADLNAPLNDDEHAQLERLLKYGQPRPARQTPAGDPASWHHLSLVFESDRYRP